MIKVTRTGPWAQVGQLLAAAPKRFQAAFDKALLQEAHFLRGKIVEGIREQAPGGRVFAPLAPTTLAIRKYLGFGGTKALLVQGDLRNSITVTKDSDRVFVGILRTARNRNGKSLVDIAALQERGSRPIVTRLTPKARAFLHAAFRCEGLDAHSAGSPTTSIAVLRVPARPFFAPVFEEYAQPEGVASRAVESIAKALGYDFVEP